MSLEFNPAFQATINRSPQEDLLEIQRASEYFKDQLFNTSSSNNKPLKFIDESKSEMKSPISNDYDTLKNEINRQAEEFSRVCAAFSEQKNKIIELQVTIDKYGKNSKNEAVVAAKKIIEESVDPRVIMEPYEYMERSEIELNQFLKSYYVIMQQLFNQTFHAAFTIQSGQFSLDSSNIVKWLQTLENLSSGLPFVPMLVISATGAIIDNVQKAKKIGQFKNFANLCPTSDYLIVAKLSEKLARKFTLTCRDQILSLFQSSTKQPADVTNNIVKARKLFSKLYDRMKENMKNQVDPALVREYFDDKLTDSELFALDHARAAVEYIMNQSAEDRIQTKLSIQEGQLDAVSRRILENVLGSYDMSNVSTSISMVQSENELKRATGEDDFHDWLVDRILEQNENIPRKEIEQVCLFLSNVKDIDTKDVFLKAYLEGKIDYDLVGFTEDAWATVKTTKELENKMPKKINKTCWPF
jgi:hypothetical protein